jgi:hypothetical protein
MPEVRGLTGYAASIKAAVPQAADADLYQIEEIMRHDILHSTLDWVPKVQFRKTARLAYEALLEIRRTSGTHPATRPAHPLQEQTAKRNQKALPPDPESQNDARAAWAWAALAAFKRETGTDLEDALGDLLCDLMHWADRNQTSFPAMLIRARAHYREETSHKGTQSAEF